MFYLLFSNKNCLDLHVPLLTLLAKHLLFVFIRVSLSSLTLLVGHQCVQVSRVPRASRIPTFSLAILLASLPHSSALRAESQLLLISLVTADESALHHVYDVSITTSLLYLHKT